MTRPSLEEDSTTAFEGRLREILSPVPSIESGTISSFLMRGEAQLSVVGRAVVLPSFQGEGVAPRVPRRTDGERGQCWGQVREGRKSRRTCPET